MKRNIGQMYIRGWKMSRLVSSAISIPRQATATVAQTRTSNTGVPHRSGRLRKVLNNRSQSRTKARPCELLGTFPAGSPHFRKATATGKAPFDQRGQRKRIARINY